jgi:hypothetical protein
MRFAILFSLSASLATMPLLNGAQSSEIRELPPAKLAASDLDAILVATHSFVASVNGPLGKHDSMREAV